MQSNSTIEVFGQVYAGDSPRDAEGAWLTANKRISYGSELVFSFGSGDRSGPVSIVHEFLSFQDLLQPSVYIPGADE
jgi:hypothetical protein